MSSSARPTQPVSKDAIFKTMVALYPWLVGYVERPVQAYAERLFRRVENLESSGTRADALFKFLECLEGAAIRSGCSKSAATAIRKNFAAHRVLQTGPHLMLALDPEAYPTHAFSLLGLSANGYSTYVSYAVSTVKLEERARKGPGWLTIDGTPTRIFALSRNQMVPYSLLARLDDLRFDTEKCEAKAFPHPDVEFRDVLPKGRFERPSHALKAANLALWPKLFGSSFSFLQIDDEDIADLCIRHLSDEKSWLRNVFVADGRIAASILTEIDALPRGPWHGLLTRSTDFFWHYDAEKRQSLRLVEQDLLNQSTGEKVARFTVDGIVEGLKRRILIPNLFLMFLVTAILPGIRVLGGSRHPLYYPLMRYVLCRALQNTCSDKALPRALASDDLPCAWGHRVIEHPDLGAGELLNGGHAWLRAIFSNGETLATACGSLSAFTSDPRWSELTAQAEKGEIARSDAQWAYS